MKTTIKRLFSGLKNPAYKKKQSIPDYQRRWNEKNPDYSKDFNRKHYYSAPKRIKELESELEKLKKELDSMPEINWSESVREFLSKRAKRLLLLKKIDRLLENSEFTEEDAERLGELSKQNRLKALKSEGIL